jgi:hypothetical protein
MVVANEAQMWQTYTAEEVIWHANHDTSTVTIAAVSTDGTCEYI